MNSFLEICLHRLIGAVYYSAENISQAVLILTAALLSIGLIQAIWYFIITVIKTRKFENYLDEISSENSDGGFRVIPDDNHYAAFTLGFLSPEIYLTSNVLNNSSDEQLEIIRLHEFAHIQRRDSLRALLWGMLARLLWFLPSVGKLGEFSKIRSEIACDSFVSKSGYDKTDIASLILSFAERSIDYKVKRDFFLSSFTDSLEARILILTDRCSDEIFRIPRWMTTLTLSILLVIGLSAISATVDYLNPSGIADNLQSIGTICDSDSPSDDFLLKLGIVCPHCGRISETGDTVHYHSSCHSQ